MIKFENGTFVNLEKIETTVQVGIDKVILTQDNASNTFIYRYATDRGHYVNLLV